MRSTSAINRRSPWHATRASWRHAAAIIALALAGCAGLPAADNGTPPAANLLTQAERYLELAGQSSESKRDSYLLDAAAELLRVNQTGPAQQILSDIDIHRLSSELAARARLLNARLALAQNKPAQSLSELRAEMNADIPASMRAENYELRANAYRRIGDLLSAAAELVKRENVLDDASAIAANQQNIWQALTALAEESLRRDMAPAPDTFSGWRELALIARAASGGANIQALIANWQTRFPVHPASSEIIDLVLARQQQEISRPHRIAVLLPQNGAVANSSDAVRDGFLAAHYQRENKAYQPIIRFYDAGNAPADTLAAYERAVADGAEFVVGPLTRPAVTRMAAGRAAVPTLMLNYSESDHTADSRFYQFGLAPEDEARQVAQRAWLDGHDHALTFVPDNDWGQRVLTAFREEWQSLGGVLLEAQSYPADASDFSEQIKRLFDLDESEQRRANLEALLQQRAQFEPSLRRDADFVFMAAFPRQARLIRPQFKFHFAGDLPVYSTSHVYSGWPDATADRDIDDVIFCDIPWILANPKSALRRDIERLWPENAKQNARLYALGADAYNIIASLGTLRLFRYERFNGYTGLLQLDEDNRILRQLGWARFSGGLPRAYE
ncbi:MAG: penicillin-binding protein activator [Chromatiales bacterium]|jgi:outer membrane PBP1 activator LpoA protein|nr:penicillin-binding protein activator [Chromatiales bacterium]